jgi:hypothetical protein
MEINIDPYEIVLKLKMYLNSLSPSISVVQSKTRLRDNHLAVLLIKLFSTAVN